MAGSDILGTAKSSRVTIHGLKSMLPPGYPLKDKDRWRECLEILYIMEDVILVNHVDHVLAGRSWLIYQPREKTSGRGKRSAYERKRKEEACFHHFYSYYVTAEDDIGRRIQATKM